MWPSQEPVNPKCSIIKHCTTQESNQNALIIYVNQSVNTVVFSALRHLDEYMQNNICFIIVGGTELNVCCACCVFRLLKKWRHLMSERETQKTTYCVYMVLFFCRVISLVLYAGPFVGFDRFTVACCSPATHTYAHTFRQFTWVLKSKLLFFAFLQLRNAIIVCNTFCLNKKQTCFLFIYSLLCGTHNVYGLVLWSATVLINIVFLYAWFNCAPIQQTLNSAHRAIKMTCEHKYTRNNSIETVLWHSSHILCARSVFMSRLLYFFFINNG